MDYQISFKGAFVSYAITGKGKPIVWLHGFLESKNIWKNQIDFFNQYNTNICIDLLGHGASEDTSGIYTMDLQAELVVAILQKHKISDYYIVGHSMGGYVLLSLLKKVSAKILGVVLLNSTSYPDTQARKLNRDRAIKILETQKVNYIRMGIVNLFSAPSRSKFNHEIEDLVKQAQGISKEGIKASLLGMKLRVNCADILKNYEGEKLIISGKSDPVILLKNSISEAEATKCEHFILEGGHMSYLEQVEMLNFKLKCFLF